MRGSLLFLSVMASLAMLAGCSRTQPAAQASTSGEAPVIRTATVQEQPVEQELEIAARVQADPAKLIHVYPPASGRLISVEVRPGDRVKQGQTLAILQSSDISSARSDYDKAQIAAGKAHRDLERAQLLYDHQVMSDRDYQQAKADAATADSELQRTRERLQLLGIAPQGASDRARLVAPRAGAVLDIQAAPGELSKSTDNSPPLITLADLSTVWIVGDVYEKDLARVHASAPVEVRISAYPGEARKATVAAVSDAVDPVTRTLKVRVVLDNPDRKLKPDMFASIRVGGEARKAIVLPASAVLREGSEASVFVKKGEQYERRAVTVARTFDSKVEIGAGVRPGDEVVVEGATLLRGGTAQ